MGQLGTWVPLFPTSSTYNIHEASSLGLLDDTASSTLLNVISSLLYSADFLASVCYNPHAVTYSQCTFAALQAGSAFALGCGLPRWLQTNAHPANSHIPVMWEPASFRIVLPCLGTGKIFFKR